MQNDSGLAHGRFMEVMRSGQILDIFKQIELTEIVNGLDVGVKESIRDAKKVFVLHIY